MKAHNSQFLPNPRFSALCPSSVAPSPAVTTCAGQYGQVSSPDDLRAAGGGGNGRQTSPARLKRRQRRLWRAPTASLHRTRPQGAGAGIARLVSGQASGTCVMRPWLSASGPAAIGPYRVTAAHTRDDGQRIGGSWTHIPLDRRRASGRAHRPRVAHRSEPAGIGRTEGRRADVADGRALCPPQHRGSRCQAAAICLPAWQPLQTASQLIPLSPLLPV
jgi:hypothetical protein